MSQFTHLHVHTRSGSLLDGFTKISELGPRVKELGQKACAITDHNLLAGCPEFLSVCHGEGIKPLLGVESYWTEDRGKITSPIEERRNYAVSKALEEGVLTEELLATLNKKSKRDTDLTLTKLNKIVAPWMYDTHSYHILFIAKDNDGWHNLVRLQSEAARTGTFNGRFHVDFELLKKYHEGLIATTACIASKSARSINNGDVVAANDYLDKMLAIFQEDFFLEIQPYNSPDQLRVNEYYMDWGKLHGVKTVATNDCHWLRREEYDDHSVMICISTGKKISDPDRLEYAPEFWVKDYNEMVESFELQYTENQDVSTTTSGEYQKYYLEALENTAIIAEAVNDNYVLGSPKPLFPVVKVPEGETPETVLTEKAMAGLQGYLNNNPELDGYQYVSQLETELGVINSKGFAPYFLCVEEYIKWCHDNDILTGPGRGSAASSLVLFCLGVTQIIDPIKYKLIFSRFLTKDRSSSPDIDMDLMWARRGDVIQHLREYYGEDHVAHIGVFSTLGVKSGLKDVCRVLEIPFGESNIITKSIDEIDNSPGLTFKAMDAWAEGDDKEKKKYEEFQQLEQRYPEIFRLARRLEGMPRQMGVHASGILVTPEPVTELTPVRYVDGVAVTILTGTQVDEQNLVKLDLLGLKTLDIIKSTMEFVNKDYTIEQLYEDATFNDVDTWEMIQEKKTDAVFQIESNLMKNLVKQIKPERFEDLSALVAVGRPGPLGCGADAAYAAGKNEGKMAKLPLRGTENIFGETFFVPLYQEQLMTVSKQVAGFNDNQADSITRKILG